jgi:hypothetical protein
MSTAAQESFDRPTPPQVTLPPTKTLPIEDIKPYFRNPRRIPQEAVDAVATSIERYGYQQPITVDKDNVIIVGHTRLQALKKLGWTQVPVYVSSLPENKAREYRLVDNKTSEMTTWDHEQLVMELREFEQGLLTTFFPDIDLEVGQISDAVTQQNVDDASRKVSTVTEADKANVHTTTVVCPSCFHSFEVRTRSLPGLTADDLDDLAHGDDGYADGAAQ